MVSQSKRPQSLPLPPIKISIAIYLKTQTESINYETLLLSQPQHSFLPQLLTPVFSVRAISNKNHLPSLNQESQTQIVHNSNEQFEILGGMHFILSNTDGKYFN